MFGHGYPVALLEEEKILPVGKEISVLELHKLNDEGVTEIKLSRELPCFLSELTKAEVEADLALNVKILLGVALAWEDYPWTFLNCLLKKLDKVQGVAEPEAASPRNVETR